MRSQRILRRLSCRALNFIRRSIALGYGQSVWGKPCKRFVKTGLAIRRDRGLYGIAVGKGESKSAAWEGQCAKNSHHRGHRGAQRKSDAAPTPTVGQSE